MNLQKISKTISYALRHNPTQFNVTLDEMGFCKIDDLLDGLKENKINIDISIIKEIVDSDEKGRYEIVNDKIRALYGHSTKNEIVKKLTDKSRNVCPCGISKFSVWISFKKLSYHPVKAVIDDRRR